PSLFSVVREIGKRNAPSTTPSRRFHVASYCFTTASSVPEGADRRASPRRCGHSVGAEDAITDHHPRAAWFIVIQPNESAVAIFRVEIRPVMRQNVCVQVDFHEICRASAAADAIYLHRRFTETPYNGFIGCGFSTFLPHFLQVRRASSFQKSTIA